MPFIPILLGAVAVALIAGLSSSAPTKPRPVRRFDPTPTLAEELEADPIGTIVKYGTASDLQAQGFGDEIRRLGYRE